MTIGSGRAHAARDGACWPRSLPWPAATAGSGSAQRSADDDRARRASSCSRSARASCIRLERPAAAVFVADPEVADVQAHSPTLVYVFGRRSGTTTLYAVDENEDVLLRREVVVEHHLSGLQQVIREVAPDSRIEVRSVDGGIILDGAVRDAVKAQELREIAGRYLGENETLINRLTVAAPTQVNLRVRVAEVSREVTKLFGINWEGIFSPGDFLFGLATGRAFTTAGGLPFLRATDAGGVGNASVRQLQQRRRQRERHHRRARARGPGQRPGRAQPHRPFRRDRELPRRRRVPGAGRPGRRQQHRDPVQAVRRQPGLHADGAERRADQHAGPARGQRSQRQGCDQARRPGHPGAVDPARRDHGRARQRPELRDRRPDLQQHAQQSRQGAGPRRPAGARAAVPLDALPAQRVRAGDHRHALSRGAGRRRAAGDAARRPRGSERPAAADRGPARPRARSRPGRSQPPRRRQRRLVGPAGFMLD